MTYPKACPAQWWWEAEATDTHNWNDKRGPAPGSKRPLWKQDQENPGRQVFISEKYRPKYRIVVNLSFRYLEPEVTILSFESMLCSNTV